MIWTFWNVIKYEINENQIVFTEKYKKSALYDYGEYKRTKK